MNYLVKATNVYRVPTVEAAIELRETLSNLDYGELTAFGYKHKEIKQKGEVIETYELCTATIQFTSEKEPESVIRASYEV